MSFKHVRLQHDNAPDHTFTSTIVTISLQKQEGNSLYTPSYSLDIAPCDIFLSSEIENPHRWTEISVQTGAWIRRIPVPN